MSEINNISKLEYFSRNNYFHGKLMTVKDFELEQNYFNSKRHLINRTINGVGLVRGLTVKDVNQRQDETWEATLSEGMLIDENGDEIIVADEKSYKISTKNLSEIDDGNFGLYIKNKPEKHEDVSTPLSGTSCEDTCQKNIIKEKFELFFDQLSDLPSVDFDLPKAADPKINNYSHEYYVRRDRDYSYKDCYKKENPKILLAVIKKDSTGKLTILEQETQYRRQIVYDNIMIYDILQQHISDSKNPHSIDAESIGAISSINEVSHPNLVFKSNSLQFITDKNDPSQKHNLAPNEIKVELKSQNFLVVTGEIEITKYSDEKHQFFGPIYFPKKYNTPPMITLAKSNHSGNEINVEYMEDFAPNFFSSSNTPKQENQINFKVLHVTNEKFSIAIDNNSKSASANPLFLRYWIIPSTGDDIQTIQLPNISQSSIKLEPFHKISDKKIKVEVVDNKVPDNKNLVKIKVESLLTRKTKDVSAIRTHAELDQFAAEILISDLTDLPGDIIRVTYENEVRETKIEPIMIINQNAFYEISENFELTITDYSQRTKPIIDVVLKVGKRETKILAKNTGEENQSKFSYRMSRIEKLQSEFKDYDIFGRGRGIQVGYSISIGDNKKFVSTNSAIWIPSLVVDSKGRIENGTWNRAKDLLAFIVYDSISISEKSSVDLFVSGIFSNGKETPKKEFMLRKMTIKNKDGIKEFGFFQGFSLADWLDHRFDRRISQIKALKATYTYHRKSTDSSRKEFTIERIINLPE